MDQKKERLIAALQAAGLVVEPLNRHDNDSDDISEAAMLGMMGGLLSVFDEGTGYDRSFSAIKRVHVELKSGYSLSAVYGGGTYSDYDTFEIAFLHPDGALVGDPLNWDDDVKGYLTVEEILAEVAEFEANPPKRKNSDIAIGDDGELQWLQ